MIRLLDDKLFKSLYQEYMTTDFPPDELKPCERILKQKKRGIAFTLGYYENDMLTGYAVVEQDRSKQFLLIDYFAILPQYRRQGKGSTFLYELKAYYQDKQAILIESETPVNETAIQRLRFYERSGARVTDIKVNLFHVDYHILVLDTQNIFTDKDILCMLKKIYKSIYPLIFRSMYLKYYD